MKKIFLIVLSVIFFGNINAQEKKNKNANHSIEVKGNCDMCKKRIEKAAYSVSGVKSASWNSENQALKIIFDEYKTSLGDVEKAIINVGHDTQNLKATDKDYENLHHCCKYKRE